MRKPWILLALLLAAGIAHGGEPHQHGVATMTVAVDANMMEIELISPMENLVGFEHAPRNEKERKAIQALKDRFGKPGTLLMPTASAGCSAGPAELELPGGADEHDHADVHAVLSYTCRSPGELKNIRVNLFDAFPKLHKLKVQLAAPGRQAAFELSSALRDIAW